MLEMQGSLCREVQKGGAMFQLWSYGGHLKCDWQFPAQNQQPEMPITPAIPPITDVGKGKLFAANANVDVDEQEE